MSDFYYYSNNVWESPFAVNYGVKARNWFITHGFRLHYVTARDMILLHKLPLIEGNGIILD